MPDEGSVVDGREVSKVFMDDFYKFCQGESAPWLNKTDQVYKMADEGLGMSVDDPRFRETVKALKDGPVTITE